MKHHTKNKGDLGVLKAKADLCSQGFLVLAPESEHSPFDIVAYDGNLFQRIQVKSRSLRNGILPISFRASWADKHGTHSRAIDKDKIDIYCIYCLDNDTCYYIEPKKFGTHCHIRVIASQHKQKNQHEAGLYRLMPMP